MDSTSSSNNSNNNPILRSGRPVQRSRDRKRKRQEEHELSEQIEQLEVELELEQNQGRDDEEEWRTVQRNVIQSGVALDVRWEEYATEVDEDRSQFGGVQQPSLEKFQALQEQESKIQRAQSISSEAARRILLYKSSLGAVAKDLSNLGL
ncbi:hypothetical protein BGZ83_000408 [Gryganskiella cystojenkinii]|nr:hypothetical protein BGZ83_000408 [Gryganskiella cystojenkinii]